ncbi:hypothetical protein H8B13_19355 [Hymenobacter sp. BT188]|uniref:hypothetical protein n=1 Tax=Hymenobacter sp. BT188 TaxID=2763504 RepID=UPI00165144F1|nr:hypothetical protein [Hymenobacter sp. BT188]MBC6608985.1 hypothetical protein [Hymenobacter sp. BT188]
MKTGTNLRWVGCLLIVCAGGLLGCENKSKPTDQGTQKSSVSATEPQIEQAEVDSTMNAVPAPFDPNAGTLIASKRDRDSAIADVKRYKKDYPQNVSSNYFSRDLISKLLADPKVRGLRVYRSQEKDRGKRKIIITGVDDKGKEIPINKEISPGMFEPDYKIGVSYERCPDNCGIFDQN